MRRHIHPVLVLAVLGGLLAACGSPAGSTTGTSGTTGLWSSTFGGTGNTGTPGTSGAAGTTGAVATTSSGTVGISGTRGVTVGTIGGVAAAGTTGGSGTTTTIAGGTGVGSTGTTGSLPSGSHAWPQVPFQGGPTLASPQIVTVTFPSYDEEADVQAWAAWAVGSTWLTTVGADYGVVSATNQNASVTTAAPTTIDDTALGGQLSALQALVDGMLGNALPAPTASTVYVLYFPSTTTVTSYGASSCSSWSAYHDAYQSQSIAGSPEVYYAVIPECPEAATEAGLTTLQHTERAASHELMEAATDPNPGNPGWNLEDSSSPWQYYGGEIADLCQEASLYTDPTGQFVARRIWSNSAALGNGAPCVPAPAADDAFAAAALTSASIDSEVSVTAGQAATITFTGWTTATTPAWPLTLQQLKGPTLTISPESVTVGNGGTVQFTVTAAAGAVIGDTTVLQLVSEVGAGVDTMPWLFGVTVSGSTTVPTTCTVTSDCPAGSSCAPVVDASGNPTAAYACKPINGEDYDGCSDTQPCTGGCCVVDANANTFCAKSCSDGQSCGSATCEDLTKASWSTCSITSFCAP